MGDGRRFVIGAVSPDMTIGYHREGAANIGMVIYGSSTQDVRQKILTQYPTAEIRD